MSEYQVFTVLAAFAFLYSVVASRLERTPVSGAVVYLFIGLACGSYGLQLVTQKHGQHSHDCETESRICEDGPVEVLQAVSEDDCAKDKPSQQREDIGYTLGAIQYNQGNVTGDISTPEINWATQTEPGPQWSLVPCEQRPMQPSTDDQPLDRE